MKIGTKSLLYGVHQFIIHPIIVFIAWWKLYGFPYDPRLWIAFIVHDWGYWGKPNMDGEEGETHVFLGAEIMHKLFDSRHDYFLAGEDYLPNPNRWYWYNFTLYHSRFYAKKNNHPVSRLCVADKYAFTILPKWLYLLLVNLSGELKEYMTTSRTREGKVELPDEDDWYNHVYKYMIDWTTEHKDNLNDTWTKTK